MKAKLRSFYRKKRASTFNRQACSKVASEKVTELIQWKNARHILLYSPIGNEIDTSLLFNMAEKEGKTVLLPVTLDLDGEMGVGIFNRDKKLCEGFFSIPEPDPLPEFALSSIDLAIVPGVAFDRQGGRLGQGKGYYDRFLNRLNAFRIGFCFSLQIHDTPLPSESHDAKMNIIVTDQEVIQCSG